MNHARVSRWDADGRDSSRPYIDTDERDDWPVPFQLLALVYLFPTTYTIGRRK